MSFGNDAASWILVNPTRNASRIVVSNHSRVSSGVGAGLSIRSIALSTNTPVQRVGKMQSIREESDRPVGFPALSRTIRPPGTSSGRLSSFERIALETQEACPSIRASRTKRPRSRGSRSKSSFVANKKPMSDALTG